MPSPLSSYLAQLPLGPVEYFPSTGSTNDIAAARLAAAAPDLTLIVAGEQTAGRGRAGRSWQSPPEASLAFSLVLRPGGRPAPLWSYAPLGALAVYTVLVESFGLPAAIKWPNDVLVGGKKVCGVLAEASWQGDRLEGVVLGIGVNVLPPGLSGELAFPATSLAEAIAAEAGGAPGGTPGGYTGESPGRPLDRWALLADILQQLLAWRSRAGDPGFVKAWEERLAYRGQEVQVGEQRGVLVGLNPEGSLILSTQEGPAAVAAGEVSLRPTSLFPSSVVYSAGLSKRKRAL